MSIDARSCTCRVAEPDYQMERDMDDGKLEGTMFGVVQAPPKHKQNSKHGGKIVKLLKSVTSTAGKYLVRA